MPHRKMEKCEESIFFIGAGSMAEALINGLVFSNVVVPKKVYVINKSNKQKIDHLTRYYEIKQAEDLQEGVSKAKIIILAVKPGSIAEVCQAIKPFLTAEHVVISVAAGVRTSVLEGLLGADAQVIRAMPNTSSAICESATGICAGQRASEKSIDLTRLIFGTVGLVALVKTDEQLDVLTGLCGSGPAYIYYIVEGMEKAGIDLGLADDEVRKLVIQTVFGAAKMMVEMHEPPSLLRKKVTSPKGTTEAGLKVFEEHKLHDVIEKAVDSARKRSIEIGKETSLKK